MLGVSNASSVLPSTTTALNSEFLIANYKLTTLHEMCGELQLKKTGNKKQKAERICDYLRTHPDINWTPSTPPDKGMYRSNESEFTPLPLTPRAVRTPAPTYQPAWGTVGSIVDVDVEPTTAVESHVTVDTEPTTAVAVNDEQDPQYVVDVPHIGARIKERELPKPEGWPVCLVKIDECFLIHQLLPYLEDLALYKVSTISWKIAAAVAAAGHRLNDRQRWGKPIFFYRNRGSDGKQWIRHLDIMFPPALKPTRHNMAVQYLSRVSKLPLSTRSNYYHKTLCMTRRCTTKTRNFHTMLMCFLCTDCINSGTHTYSLMSRDVAKRFYALTRTKLEALPCARFRDAKSQHGPAPRWFMKQHVRQLSEKVWRAKSSSKRKGRLTASRIEINSEHVSWKAARAERIQYLNRKRCNPQEPYPPANSSVSLDLAVEVEPPTTRRHQPVSIILRRLMKPGQRPAHRPVTAGTEVIRLKEFTIGLNGGRAEVVDEPDIKNRRRKIKRLNAFRSRRKRKLVNTHKHTHTQSLNHSLTYSHTHRCSKLGLSRRLASARTLMGSCAARRRHVNAAVALPDGSHR